MRKYLIIIMTVIFSLLFTGTSFALNVGGQADVSIPETSFFSREEAVEKTLDSCESGVSIKAGFDVEFITEKKLNTSSESSNAKIEGQNANLKISMNYSDVLEPYVKIGTSDLKVKWEQNGSDVVVDAKPGFVLGGGVKAKLWEFASTGIRLTMDGQYKDTQLDFDKTEIGGSTVSATNETFDIKEWQISLLASKKFIISSDMRDCYTIIPYTGLTYTDSDVDVFFTQSGSGLVYSTYNGGNKNPMGVVLGFDIMPSLVSWYLFSFELRLISETSFTLSGTAKF